mmetsp:Transcript_40011/g.118645  ORF Transcript_40011/g.118645 Transcript_40011/m.118645 type:complete len:960 (+) Transcript_40011:113-2992(+)
MARKTLQSELSASSLRSDEHLLGNGNGHRKGEANDCVMVVSRCIYRLRYFWVLFWVVTSVFMAPCALLLIERAAPMSKVAPEGTESSRAMAHFKEHYENLAAMRREMVVFRCKETCESAESVMSRGFVQQLTDLVKRFGNDHPGSIVQIHSYYSFSEHHQLGENPMMAQDKQSILLQWIWRVPPELKPAAEALCIEVEALIDEINAFEGPGGLDVAPTGLVFLDHAMKETLIEEIPVHEVSTIWLPFIILAFALRSARMLLLALIPMPIEIIVSFGIMYFVSLQTTVVLFALMMMLMLCTSLSFDYALFTLTRYAEERANGRNVEDSILTVISQSGRVVAVSGCVLVISWAAMLGLPPPFNGFCVAAVSMVVVCVLVQLTFVPSLLAIMPFLGPPASNNRGQDSRSFDAVHASEFAHDPMTKAAPHMRGVWYLFGKWLTAFPLNVLLPLAVYAAMMPLTMRMSKNFDLQHFKFIMGHGFELSMPRVAHEWKTLLQIQEDFPSETGILMPIMIMARHVDGSEVQTPTASAGAANRTLTDESGLLTDLETVVSDQLDVTQQKFFDANCDMVNRVIQATKGKRYALLPDKFVSATFHGPDDEDSERVKCLQTWEIETMRSTLMRKVFLKHTSEHLEELWDQLVSQKGHAMLTFVFPPMDPFSPDAFDLVTDVRGVLRDLTLAGQQWNATIPGLEFETFSPGSVLKDLIEVTSKQLPLCFLGCAAVCLTLIAIWFGSVFIPFKLLFTVIVPITWTYGAGLYVYEDGILEGYDWMPAGILPTRQRGTAGNDGMDWTVPMFTLTFIMGLALDYEIFLFERVREFREEGFGDRESIQLGLSATGGTISSAGLIMALTFMAQMLGSIPVTNQMGFILVFSIVVDTFVVRSILVPSMLSLFPCCNYWPSKMPQPRYRWLGWIPETEDEDSPGPIREGTDDTRELAYQPNLDASGYEYDTDLSDSDDSE